MTNSIKKETQEKISQLQMIEETLQQYAASKQTINSQILEIDSALSELEGKKSAYKIVGAIMIEKDSVELKNDLLERKKVLDIKSSSIERHEEKVRQKFDSLQKQVMQEISGSGKDEI